MAGGAGTGPGGEECLQFPDYLVEAQSCGASFGSRASRCRVQKAWAAETRGTWWCQARCGLRSGPVPGPVSSRGTRVRCASAAWPAAPGWPAASRRAGWRARTAPVRSHRQAIRPAASARAAQDRRWSADSASGGPDPQGHEPRVHALEATLAFAGPGALPPGHRPGGRPAGRDDQVLHALCRLGVLHSRWPSGAA